MARNSRNGDFTLGRKHARMDAKAKRKNGIEGIVNGLLEKSEPWRLAVGEGSELEIFVQRR